MSPSIREILTESSLSRVYRHNELHDCGALTAFRKAKDCGLGELYTKKEKAQRNKSLRSKLLVENYGVTSIKGMYPEAGTMVKEESYFVVDRMDKGNLREKLMELGEYFEQDSILFIPKGTVLGKDKALLIGTNRCPNGYPGYNRELYFNGSGKFGYDSEIYTSYVNGRPFIFEEYSGEKKMPGSFSNWGVASWAKRDWRNIEVFDDDLL